MPIDMQVYAEAVDAYKRLEAQENWIGASFEIQKAIANCPEVEFIPVLQARYKRFEWHIRRSKATWVGSIFLGPRPTGGL